MKYLKQFELINFYDEKDIFRYLYHSDLPKIKELVSEIPNINLNIKDKNGDTPLIYSIRFSLFTIFKFLIESGADINYTDTFGNTPLILAGRNKKEEMTQYLIESGADLDIRNNDGETVLIMCSNYKDKKAFKIIKMLIENDADWNVSDDLGNTFIEYLYPLYKKEIIEKYPDKYNI